ncbi:hypothetical protein [Embleya sp. NPDC001921]
MSMTSAPESRWPGQPRPRRMTLAVYRVDERTGDRIQVAEPRTVVVSERKCAQTNAYPACRCPGCRPPGS